MPIRAAHGRLKQILEQVRDEHSWKVLKLAIQPNHVNLSLRALPYTLPTDYARKLNGRSSHLMGEAFSLLRRKPPVWTRSIYYATEGKVNSAVIKRAFEL